MRKAFSLIELTMAVTIITSLVGIGFCLLPGKVETANRVQCISNLDQIGKALSVYGESSRFGEYPLVGPMGYDPRGNGRGLYGNGKGLLAEAYIYRCPSVASRLSGTSAASIPCDYLRSWWSRPGIYPNVVIAGDYQKSYSKSVGNHGHQYSSLLFRDGHVLGMELDPGDPNVGTVKGAYAADDKMYATGEIGMSMSTHTYLNWND